MTLSELARLYLGSRIGLSPRYRQELLSLTSRCDGWIRARNGATTTRSFQGVSEWLQELSDLGRSPATIATYRRMLASVLAFGQRHGYCESCDLPQVRVRRRIPTAWTAAEVARIVATAKTWPGMVADCRAGDWWPALLLTIYWTAARVGSVVAAKTSDWHPECDILLLRRTKNGDPASHRLHEQAASAVGRIYDPRTEWLFPWPHNRRRLFADCRRIIEAAGVPCPRQAFGLFHKLRRTTLSYCWAADPAVAQRQADHASPETTRRHYVDPRIVGANGRCAADVLPVLQLPPAADYRQLRLFDLD